MLEDGEEDFLPSFLNADNNAINKVVSHNGLMLCNVYIPQEIITHILSFLEPKELLTYCLVCQNWNKIIKSPTLWFIFYEKQYKRKAENLPWYLYYCLLTTNYFTNMLDGEKVKHWKFIIETIDDFPVTGKCLPQDIMDYHKNIGNNFLLVVKTRLKPQMRRTFCFRPEKCYTEHWIFGFERNKLIRHIVSTYKPHLYLKGCGDIYGLQCGFIQYEHFNGIIVDSFLARQIKRKIVSPLHVYSIEVTITDYPNTVIEGIAVENKHLEISAGGTLDGAEVRFLFDSIMPSEDINSQPDLKFEYKN